MMDDEKRDQADGARFVSMMDQGKAQVGDAFQIMENAPVQIQASFMRAIQSVAALSTKDKIKFIDAALDMILAERSPNSDAIVTVMATTAAGSMFDICSPEVAPSRILSLLADIAQEDGQDG